MGAKSERWWIHRGKSFESDEWCTLITFLPSDKKLDWGSGKGQHAKPTYFPILCQEGPRSEVKELLRVLEY